MGQWKSRSLFKHFHLFLAVRYFPFPHDPNFIFQQRQLFHGLSNCNNLLQFISTLDMSHKHIKKSHGCSLIILHDSWFSLCFNFGFLQFFKFSLCVFNNICYLRIHCNNLLSFSMRNLFFNNHVMWPYNFRSGQFMVLVMKELADFRNLFWYRDFLSVFFNLQCNFYHVKKIWYLYLYFHVILSPTFLLLCTLK